MFDFRNYCKPLYPILLCPSPYSVRSFFFFFMIFPKTLNMVLNNVLEELQQCLSSSVSSQTCRPSQASAGLYITNWYHDFVIGKMLER